MMRIKPFLILSILLFLVGCHTMRKGAISQDADRVSGEKIAAPEKYELNIAVVPFEEKRGILKKYGSVYTYLIPLVPYGTMRYERPDEARMFNIQDEYEFNMGGNLLKVVVDSLKKSNLFNSVVFSPNLQDAKADLILAGELRSTLYEGKTYSYGISFLGPALWCFGLPAGSSHKKLNLILSLKKADTNEVIWSYDIDREKTVVRGLYRNWGKNVNSFIALLEEGMDEVILDMKEKLANIPLDKIKSKQPELPAQIQKESDIPSEEKIPAVTSDSGSTDEVKTP